MTQIWYGKDFRLGMLGGGQLGRMFIQQALNYDLHVHCLDPDAEAPCHKLASSFTVGSLTDYDTVYAFGKDKDVLTIEIENVNVDALEKLEKEGITIYPQPSILKMIKDKGLQKEFYSKNNIPTSPYFLTENAEETKKKAKIPYALKLRTGGYDGKGVQIIKSKEDEKNIFDAPSLIEELIPFEKELSVIVARNKDGETACFPTVECEFSQEANLVEFLFSPAEVNNEIELKAQLLAKSVVDKMGFIGILAVEMFLLKDGNLLVNEVAPRPHNSGHQTIEGNITSQFEQHLRSILNLPLGSTEITQPSVMLNLLGEKSYEGKAKYQGLEKIIGHKGVNVHLYGKQITKPFRKMGHITVVAKHMDEAKKLAYQVKKEISVIS
ncbi:MAG: 5-(carboxyamino)imidazole ribonucleotide synthase [Lentimonas sp.]|jgi:5-(carboxyamino)imidazole ribonucleotide synthase